MARRFSAPTLLLCLLLVAAPAVGEVVQKGSLRVVLDGGFSPHSLPRDRLAPVRVQVEGRISTTDGSQPAPLRELKLELNRKGHVDARGLAVCRPGRLQSANTTQALERCRPALVGRGSFGASFDFGSNNLLTTTGAVLVFNSRSGDRTGLLLHFYTSTPAEASLVLPLRLERENRGHFGIALRTKIPRIAGKGAITALKLTLGRTFSVNGRQRSYISASCEAPAGFPGAVFPFLRGTFTFADTRPFHTTLSRDCSVRRG